MMSEGYGAIPGMSPTANNNPAFAAAASSPDSFVGFFTRLGMTPESDHHRLDLAQFLLVACIVAGNFVHPFASAGAKLACVLHNIVSMFSVPALVIIAGFRNAELTPQRRRSVIAFLLVPYLLLQSVYLAVYIMLYWNVSFRDHPGRKDVDRADGELTYNW